MNSQEVIKKLKAAGSRNQKDLEGMARYGINTQNTLCISMPALTQIAKEIKKEPKEVRHQIALEIWETGIREARILAGIIDVPELVTSKQMESWVKDFNSWDVTDNTIMKLFSYSPLGWEKAIPWSMREPEYQKRAGFVLMAMLAMHDKNAKDEDYYPFFERIKQEATDERNFVKKAVNWSLRQMGKSKSKVLYKKALETANEILNETNLKIKALETESLQTQNSELAGLKAARWIAKDAIRELNNTPYILRRFKDE